MTNRLTALRAAAQRVAGGDPTGTPDARTFGAA
jgi:HAMP domain-containing protein